MQDHEKNAEENDQSRDKKELREFRLAKNIMSITGYIVLLGSIGLLALLAYGYFRYPDLVAPELKKGQEITLWILQHYTDDILIFLGAIFFSLIGIRLLGAAGKGTPTIIPPDDRKLLEPLIEKANRDAINQYVILSSLSGFTGTFQKIGFSGLPLATVTLTLIFSFLSFFEPAFLELTKLTLGAFIGSFVQKGTDAAKLPSIKWSE